MTAFLASRGDGGGDAVGMRDFGPMERSVFDTCLDCDIPIVWIIARGLPDRFLTLNAPLMRGIGWS